MDALEAMQTAMTRRILVLEGPKGTMIQAEGLQEDDYRGLRFRDHPIPLRNNNEMLNLVRPDLIESIHLRFAQAGADIVATNTFNGNRISQADFGAEHLVGEINREAARIARAAAERAGARLDRPIWIAGTMGPTPRTASLSPDVARPGYRNTTFDELAEAYGEQASALIEGGVDLLILETTFDTLNAKAAIYALKSLEQRGVRVPALLVSVTFSDRSGRTLSGQTLEAFWLSVSHAAMLAIGINCGLGAAEMQGLMDELSRIAPIPTACYPNAGLPNAFGGYDQSPSEMGALLGEFAANGWLNIVGGCCGSKPEHISAIAEAVRGHAPRVPVKPERLSQYSGLEALTIRPDSNFIMIGERTNVSGSRKFARLIRAGRYEEGVAIARDQVEGGANIIDVNMDEALLDAPAAMRDFLNTLASEPEVSRVPVMVDSSNWDVIIAGLKATQGKSIVNSISLKDGEDVFRNRAREARMFGAAIVVMAFDEEGQADTVERKVGICTRAYRILTEDLGIPPQDIIFDPNVLAIGTGIEEHADYGRAFIEAVRRIKAACPGAKCSGGISNLSFAFRGNDTVREAMHAVFLYHAIHAGLDMGIVNAGQLAVYEDIEPTLREAVEDLILNRRSDATERLLALAETVGPTERRSVADDTSDQPLDARIASSLIHGTTDTIDSEMDEAMAAYGSALAVIEGPLMGAMKTIGDRFADGRMFLPQVVKSARTMKRAVARLTPYMSAAQADESASGRARIILATVKGDVHDIGKNIVGVVLACSGHEIIDLGVMVPADTILSEAVERGATIVGLSGLITPSLDEMVHVAREMERRKMAIPLLIGGATTSRMHTAVRIAPEYSGPVVHVQDASRAGGVVRHLMEAALRAEFERSVRAEQDQLRAQFASRREGRKLLALTEARSRRPAVPFDESSIAKPSFTGVRRVDGLTVAAIRPYIDWTPFFHVWDIKGRYPDILEAPEVGESAAELFRDAQGLLDELETNPEVGLRAVYGFFEANACGDDIVLRTEAPHGSGISGTTVTFHMLRQQADKGPGTVNHCLADYVAPSDTCLTDYVGLFAVTAGEGLHNLARESRDRGDDYRAIMIEALADRLAEALAEYLHLLARRDCGFGWDEHLSPDDLLKERYRGIRPAPGYPACPDHSEKPLLMALLGGEQATGIRLTQSMAMSPPSSVCGFYINHPEARYFPVGTIGRDQLEDYAGRRGVSVDEAARWLSSILN